MTTSVRNKVKLPTWLREVIDEGEPTDNLINKREEPRIVARLLINAQRINAQRDDHSNANPFPVRLWDVSTKGMSFVARIGVLRNRKGLASARANAACKAFAVA